MVGEGEPSIVFAENVAGHLGLGAEQVIADLQGLGYEVAGGLFTAAEVGASHQRERLFILAWPTPEARNHIGYQTAGGKRFTRLGTVAKTMWSMMQSCIPLARNAGSHDPDAERRAAPTSSQCSIAKGREPDAAASEQRDANDASADYPLFPPGPTDVEQWEAVPTWLWPATEPGLCGLADGLAADRSRWLRLFGNGVVPLQAAYAFVSLWAVIASRRNARSLDRADPSVGGTIVLPRTPNTAGGVSGRLVRTETPYALAT